jgi:hypothetical protein
MYEDRCTYRNNLIINILQNNAAAFILGFTTYKAFFLTQ